MQSVTSGSIQSPTASERNEKRWSTPADIETVERTIAALKERGIQAELVRTKTEALERLTQLIPPGSQVMPGASKTLEDIGFVESLKSGSHEWKNVKAEIFAEKDQAKQMELRQRSILSQYYLGSVHAVTESGEVLIASAGGSQLAAYAAGAKNVIWVVGTQKIVPNLEDGLARIHKHSLPLEDQRMKGVGYPGSFVGKILIVGEGKPLSERPPHLRRRAIGF